MKTYKDMDILDFAPDAVPYKVPKPTELANAAIVAAASALADADVDAVMNSEPAEGINATIVAPATAPASQAAIDAT